MNTKIEARQTKEKLLLLEQFKKTPIVQIACERIGIGRATYYRWRKEDPDFATAADESLEEGNFLVNDLAESKLINLIKNDNLGAVAFWLKHHHQAYLTKVEITSGNKKDESLNPDQQESVKKALIMAGIVPQKDVDKKQDE